MHSHIHMILARHGKQNLDHVIIDVKKYTSSKIIDAINNNPQESRRYLLMWLFKSAGTRNPNNTKYRFWQQHNHPIELTTDSIVR